MTNSGYWVERKSARGYTYRVWRSEPMPRIEQHYLDCAIYLYDSVQSAKAGENFGGSGCLVSIRGEPVFDKSYRPTDDRLPRRRVSYWTPDHIYAVTNNHVARRGFPVIRLNTVDGETDVLDLHHGDWKAHPDGDDLAIAPIDLPHGIHCVPIQAKMSLSSAQVQRVGAGDDTFMVGRFINHSGKQRNTPSLRFGNIAMLPFEKVKLGKEANYHEQEAFLVESRSISGFSGSPVFVYQPVERYTEIPPDYESLNPKSSWALAEKDAMGELYLLGIDCGHIPKYEKVVNGALTPHPQWKVDTNTGMSIVIPAWRLMDLLNKPEFEMQRKAKDEKYKQEKEQEETVSLDVERPEPFTKESYQDALRRASRKVSESKDSDKKE